MRVSLLTACLSIMLFIILGCSKEEPPLPEAERPRIVKQIIPPKKESNKDDISGKESEESEEGKGEADLRENSESVGEEPEIEVSPAISKSEKDKDGYYTVKWGESLSSIAAGKEIYGDPLKWTVLYGLNLKIFGNIGR